MTKTTIIHTVDCIIRYKIGIVVIERMKYPEGLALPGGHLEEHETLEQAVVREIQEETGLRLKNLVQFKTYSDPKRDPRYRAISTVFIADGMGTLKAGDDAKKAYILSWAEIEKRKNEFAFDHCMILQDWRSNTKLL